MAVLSCVSTQTKADKDPGLVYACLVDQFKEQVPIKLVLFMYCEYLALTR